MIKKKSLEHVHEKVSVKKKSNFSLTLVCVFDKKRAF